MRTVHEVLDEPGSDGFAALAMIAGIMARMSGPDVIA
jgi:hypothetical protein